MLRLALLTGLIALTALPASAQEWTVAAFGGFGSDEAYRAGGGISIGHTLASGFYLGARGALFGGGDRDLEVETSATTREDFPGNAKVRYIAFEWGRTLVDSDVRLRLTSLLGLASIAQETDSTLPAGATLDDPRSELLLGPGLTLDVPLGGVILGGEARLMNVTHFRSFGASLRLGFGL